MIVFLTYVSMCAGFLVINKSWHVTSLWYGFTDYQDQYHN